jgi:hypothetical protein
MRILLSPGNAYGFFSRRKECRKFQLLIPSLYLLAQLGNEIVLSCADVSSNHSGYHHQGTASGR